MAQLRQEHGEFTRRGAEVLVVGPDNLGDFREYWEKEGLPFVGLADTEGTVARLYAQEVNALKFGRMPALFIIDKTGVIRYAHHGNSMMDIPKSEAVLAVLDEINFSNRQS